MKGFSRFVIGLGVALAFAAPAPIADAGLADDDDHTLIVLGDALDALDRGDLDRYAAVAERLRRDDHWLPDEGWNALDDADAGRLAFVWLLLDGDDLDVLTTAYEGLATEHLLLHELVTFGDDVLQPTETGDEPITVLDLLRLADEEGAATLQVLDRRSVHVSPDARRVLALLPADPIRQPPDLATYERVLEAMANRLEGPVDDPIPPAEPVDVPAGATVTPADAAAPQWSADAPNGPPVDQEAGQPSDEDDGAAPEIVAHDGTAADGVNPITIGLGVLVAVALVMAAISMRRHHHHARLVDVAFTDGLTGLRNRRRFDTDLAAQARHGDRPTSVLMIDVDHFKSFNDTHGHAVGDVVLRTVGEVLSANLRKQDVSYRYGGEEFSVLLPGTDEADAARVGERIRAAIEAEPLDVGGRPATLTVSIGMSSGHADHVDELVERADQALYAAKRAGRNRLASA